tara:strand:- start:54470 stop:57325 length:2856 start_codon:yes stop_codon:yes gene_type:complete
MSNDIFYTNLSNLVTFYMGERPSADKFNAVNKYFSRGMRELATAIGDVYDDGFPYIGEAGGLGPSWNVYETGDGGNKSRPLDIVSLARIIGPTSNLNARMHNSYNGTGITEIQEFIPSGNMGFELQHPIYNDGINMPSVQSASGGYVSYNETAGFQTLPDPWGNDFFKIINNRHVLFNKETTEDVTITYRTKSSDYYGGIDYEEAGFNTIPDPNQTDGVSIELLGDGRYKIDFPQIEAQQSGLINLKSSAINTADEFNNNKYYELPKWLIRSIANEEDQIIPGNFIHLKNRVTQEVYKDAVYKYESPTSLIVSNINLCTEDDGISYSSTDYCIILTGTNITNVLDDLRLKWFKHSHDGTFGESPIHFKSLVGKFVDIPPSGLYGPSSHEWNQMPMYLHRDGYVVDGNTNNGDNAMRGDLMLGDLSFDPLTSGTTSMGDLNSGNSHKILLSRSDAFMRLYNNQIQIINDIPLEEDPGAGIYIQSQGDSYRTSAESIIDIGKYIKMQAATRIDLFANWVSIQADVTEILNYKTWQDMNANPSYQMWNLLSVAYGFDPNTARFPETSGRKELNDNCLEGRLLSLAKVNFSFKEEWVSDFETKWQGLETAHISPPFEFSPYDSGMVSWSGFFANLPGADGPPFNSVDSTYTNFLEEECAITDGTKIEKLIIETFYSSSRNQSASGRWLFEVSHEDPNCIYDIGFGDHTKTLNGYQNDEEAEWCVHPLYNINWNAPNWTAKHVGIVINRFKNYYSALGNSMEEIRSTFYIKVDTKMHGRVRGQGGNGPKDTWKDGWRLKISFNYNGILNDSGEYVSILTREGKLDNDADNGIGQWKTRASSSTPYNHNVGADNFDDKKAFILADNVFIKIEDSSSSYSSSLWENGGDGLDNSIILNIDENWRDEVFLKVEESYINRKVFLTISESGPYVATNAAPQILDWPSNDIINNQNFKRDLV